MKAVKLILVLGLLILSTGCSSKLMAPLQEGVAPFQAETGEPVVVFYRESPFGGAVQSTLYEIVDGKIQFLGILSPKMKLAHQTTSGNKTYMVLGESANYLEADVEGNNVYYARVAPRFGWVKTRFILEAISGDAANSEEVQKDLAKCKYVQNTPEAEAWFRDNIGSIQRKHDKYYPKWLESPEVDKAILHPTDGTPY